MNWIRFRGSPCPEPDLLLSMASQPPAGAPLARLKVVRLAPGVNEYLTARPRGLAEPIRSRAPPPRPAQRRPRPAVAYLAAMPAAAGKAQPSPCSNDHPSGQITGAF